jgi:hypothetical protein
MFTFIASLLYKEFKMQTETSLQNMEKQRPLYWNSRIVKAINLNKKLKK